MHCRVTPSTLSQAVGPGLHLESSSHTEYAAAGQALSTQKYASPGPGRRATNHMASFQFLSLSLSPPLSLSLSPSLPLLDLARGQENPARVACRTPKGVRAGASWTLQGVKRTPPGVACRTPKGVRAGALEGVKREPRKGCMVRKKPPQGVVQALSISLSLSLSFARAILSLSLSRLQNLLGLPQCVCVCVCVCHKLRLQSHSCSRRTLEVLLQNQKYHS